MSKKLTSVVLSLALAFVMVCTSITCAFAASSSKLTVTAYSDLFDSSSVILYEGQNQVKVTFELGLTGGLVNTDCEIIYDPAVLTPVSTNESDVTDTLPNMADAYINFCESNDESSYSYSDKYGKDDLRRVVVFNASSYDDPYDFSTEKVFVTMLFDVAPETSVSDTTVELWVKYLGVKSTGSDEVQYLVNNGNVSDDIFSNVVSDASVSIEALTKSTEPTESTTESTAATTAKPTAATESTTESTAATTAKPTTEPTAESTSSTSEDTSETSSTIIPITVPASATEATEFTDNSSVTVPSSSTEATEDASTDTNSGTLMLGDVNVDGQVSIADVTVLQKGIAQILTLTDEQNVVADVNGDNIVSITDATIIQKYIAQIITEFPAAN